MFSYYRFLTIYYFLHHLFHGKEGDWSKTETITVPASSVSPSSTTTVSLASVSGASYESLLLIATIALVVIALLLAVIIFLTALFEKTKDH